MEANGYFGRGVDLSEVFIFGGAYHDFKEALNRVKWYPHQSTDENPEFVNARGMYKFMRYQYKTG